MNDDDNYFVESVGEQLFLILMSVVITLAVVGIMLTIALQKGTRMSTVWKAELTEEHIKNLSENDKLQIRRDFDKAIEAICESYGVQA